MTYKYSKGSQVIGDLKAADDTERNTLIDFGEDQIEFQTSGSVRLQISNNHLSSSLPISASALEISGKSVLNDDITVASLKRIYLDGTGISANQGPYLYGSTSTMYLDGDDNMYLYHDSRMSIFHGTNRVFDIDGGAIIIDTTMSSSNYVSASSFAFADSIKIAGASPGQDTVIDSNGNFYGDTINVGTVSGSNIVVTNGGSPVYQLPVADGTSDQVMKTDGAGNVTFDSVANLGIPSFIAYGYNVTFTGTGPIETTTVNGSTNDYGYRMPASGQVTHITAEIQYLINTSGTYDFIAEVYKNGAVTGQTGSVTITGNAGAANNTGFVKLLDSPVSFVSGDRLTIYMNFDAAGIQADDAALLLRVVTTN
jgi:hypothetical protein